VCSSDLLKNLKAVVLEDSAAWNYLQSLSALERAAYELTELPKNLGRDPLDIVASGRAEVTLIDGFEYANLRTRYPSLDVAFGVEARRPLYWMVRKDGRDLLKEVNRFLLEQREKKSIPDPASEIDPSTLPDTHAEQFAVDLEVKLPLYRELFESASAETNLDWQLILEQVYQRSRKRWCGQSKPTLRKDQ
jgi:membrane-bound lytic murein transglycosylase F